jgi:hypothetical protein
MVDQIDALTPMFLFKRRRVASPYREKVESPKGKLVGAAGIEIATPKNKP